MATRALSCRAARPARLYRRRPLPRRKVRAAYRGEPIAWPPSLTRFALQTLAANTMHCARQAGQFVDCKLRCVSHLTQRATRRPLAKSATLTRVLSLRLREPLLALNTMRTTRRLMQVSALLSRRLSLSLFLSSSTSLRAQRNLIDCLAKIDSRLFLLVARKLLAACLCKSENTFDRMSRSFPVN